MKLSSQNTKKISIFQRNNKKSQTHLFPFSLNLKFIFYIWGMIRAELNLNYEFKSIPKITLALSENSEKWKKFRIMSEISENFSENFQNCSPTMSRLKYNFNKLCLS